MCVNEVTIIMQNPEQANRLLHELRDPSEQLINRHLNNTRIWYPNELIPERNHDPKKPWTPDIYPLKEGIRSAVLVNQLTEENLPHYFKSIADAAEPDHPLDSWGRQWTTEEGRHGKVIGEWIHATGAIDPRRLEDGRMKQVIDGKVPKFEGVHDLGPYASIQESATKIAHRNTGRKLGKERGGLEVMGRVAGDESLHEDFYTDLTVSAIEIDPSFMVVSIASVVKNFSMPGTGIDNFNDHTMAISKEGIFGANELTNGVIKPKLDQWGYWDLANLSPEAEKARDGTERRIKALGVVVARELEMREQYQQDLSN